MRKLMFVFLALVATIVLFGVIEKVYPQGAKVVALSPDDAKQAKALDDEQKALIAKAEAFREHIQKVYLTSTSTKWEDVDACYHAEINGLSTVTTELNAAGQTVGPPRFYYKRGWNCGQFVYSEDFKFIVPAPDPPHCSNITLFSNPGGSNITAQ